ncbi:SEL1-like repeat protein [Pedobacter sp. N36a]|uniref:SEL1-like repeat protein n=1 Tax=Pedobacter sp. N36a TaxID=2767996 RepID=UPI0016571D67|nr:SEL1-like repeat protein [Pedobacter sp. N36a]MBC8986998.1 SEL1-like repeat protein [Pedobacter sp. N36a]
MSHRAYLYNLDTPSIAENSDIMMMEWKYEMPLMLQPLLIEGGFIAGNSYNNHVEFNNSGLFYDAQPGIENLKRFYNFLEAQPKLIENLEKFKEARDKLFNYLDQLDGAYFHLDMWDIFNMDDITHEEQAAEWLASITYNNRVITAAMDANDISLLNYKNLKDVSPAFTTFSKLLNYEDYEYGWICIYQEYEEEEEFQLFEENQLWGFKNKEGEVILSPQFDEFYTFSHHDLAVVSKKGKYGYLNTSGKIVIPLIWDDAFDFEYSEVAVVALQGKMGLINTKGEQVTAIIYDDLKSLNDGTCYNATDGLWGVITADGKVVIPLAYENEIEEGYGYYHVKIPGQKNEKIFNELFNYLGEYPVSALENIQGGLLLVKPHKGVNFSSIFKKDGSLLVTEFDKLSMETNFPDLLVIRKEKKHAAISRKTEDFILPFEYDSILDIGITLDGDYNYTDQALVQQGNQKGIFNGNPEQLSWLIPLDNYQQIIWLNGPIFALKKNKTWAIANPESQDFSEFIFDLIIRKPGDNGFAYAFKDDQVYTVTENSISPTDQEEALEHASYDYVYAFEYDSRKRLLSYGKGQKMTDQQIDDELSDSYLLFEKGEQAYEDEDYGIAIYYYTIASEKGHSYSMNNLAHIYYSIQGFKNNDKAYFWYQKNALTPNEDAMNGLGMCYKYGIGCDVDIEKAIYWLNKAADAQSALANNNLGDIYSDEELLPYDLEKALIYYQQAEKHGEPRYNWLGYLHDLKAEYEKALEYYKLGAEEENEISAFNFAILNSKGLGTPKNNELAIKYFELSAVLGYPNAHMELARIYRNEKGFQDEKKVEIHLKEARAADLEIPEELLEKKKGWFGF